MPSDLVVLLATSGLPLGLVKATELLKSSGALSSTQARKFLHILTGLLFMLTWPLYSAEPSARYYAAALPGLMALRFILAGLGVTDEAKLVAGTARSGRRRELLAGPTLYGLAHVALTILAWRTSPAGVAGLSALCAGDGLADIVGRAVAGRLHGSRIAAKLPHAQDKSWMGSLACAVGACAATAGLLLLFNRFGYLQAACGPGQPRAGGWMCVPGAGAQQLSLLAILAGSAAVGLTAAVVESLPIGGVDNVTVPASAAAVAWLVLGCK